MRKGFKLPSWRVTSPFGVRVHPITKQRRMHNGVDYGVARGTSILAIASGVVVGKWFSGNTSGYGHSLKVRNYDGSFSFYAHMNAASKLRVGDKVEVGKTVIGAIGSTGAATGPHLHLEVALNEAGSQVVDPVSYAKARPLQRVVFPKPAAKVHVVKRGETLGSIARAYGTTWQALHKLNAGVIGSNPNRIFVGQTLRLPGKAAAPKPARKTNAQLATEVLQGKWGNGPDRKKRLEAAGYNYAAVQAEVNRRV